MIGSVIGNYRIEGELGEGGMSHVYVGRTQHVSPFLPSGYQVVLKVINDELASEATAKKRFVKEAQILSKLRHRYITRFYEFIPREEGSVLVMEFIDGTPVDKLLAEGGALSIADAVTVTQCLLEALVYAHGKGIVHRDIKPANLIRKPDGAVKVTDFGIAKIRESGGSTGQTVLTRSGFLLGTPHYMSPEQIREPKDAGAKADIYSSAVVLYEMLTGLLPFNSKSLPKLIESVYRGEKQRPSVLRPEVDSELEAIVLKGMHPDPEQRFNTAREFFEALEEYNLRPMVMAMETPATGVPATQPPTTRQKLKEPEPLQFELVPVHDGQGEKHSIDGEIMVGRDRSCSIVLSHPAVSRRHARITFSGTSCLLEDLKSANGTYVNNARVDRVNLKPGDVIRFGADPSCSYVVKSAAAMHA